MEKKIRIYKSRLTGLYGKLLLKIEEAFREIGTNSNQGYLPYSTFNSKICRSFSISKQEARETIQIFLDIGYLTMGKRGLIFNFKLI